MPLPKNLFSTTLMFLIKVQCLINIQSLNSNFYQHLFLLTFMQCLINMSSWIFIPTINKRAARILGTLEYVSSFLWHNKHHAVLKTYVLRYAPNAFIFSFGKINAIYNQYLSPTIFEEVRMQQQLENLFVYGNVVLLPKSISENCKSRCCYSLVTDRNKHISLYAGSITKVYFS